MKTNNEHVEHITTMLKLIGDDNIELVDFDNHRAWLRELSEVLPKMYQTMEEVHILRTDYIERITGMMKAIAVVDRTHTGLQEALAYLDTISHLSAEKLVEQYRLVSGRFRDTFPASFGNLAPAVRTEKKKSKLDKSM